jgi:hypothetical protein
MVAVAVLLVCGGMRLMALGLGVGDSQEEVRHHHRLGDVYLNLAPISDP